MALARLNLTAPESAFASAPSRWARLSFLQVDDNGVPVISQACNRAVVVVWPGDERVDVEAARRGEAQATTWDLSPAEVAALARLVRAGWRFDRYDLLVRGGPTAPEFVPALWSLRTSPFAPQLSPSRIELLMQGAA
jgi:hypothetical protein